MSCKNCVWYETDSYNRECCTYYEEIIDGWDTCFEFEEV